MGKIRHPKQPKVNPTGISSMRDVLNAELLRPEDHLGRPISAIVDQLQSVNVEEKMCGLQSLSFLCQHEQRIADIIESDIVKMIASWLMDPSKNIRNATAGALRNLSMNGFEVCENLVEQDLLTPLLTLLNEYAVSDWIPEFSNEMNNQLDEHSDTFLQAVNLVWNLCESTGVALANFNQSTLVKSFIRHLDYKVFGMDISIAVAQCLLVITEDNPTAWNTISCFSSELLSLLSIEGNHAHTLLSTLAAGILANIPAFAALHLNLIFVTLSKTLNINHRHILNTLTSALPLTASKNEIFVTDDANALQDESDHQANMRRRKQDMPTEVEIEVKFVSWLLEAQRVSAETINNLCASEDDEIVNEEDNNSDAESLHDCNVSSPCSSSGNLQNTDRLPNEILEAIKSLGLVEKLWQRAQPIPQNVADIMKEKENTLAKKVTRLQISSHFCLQNLCNSMNTEDLGGPTAIYNVWLDLGQQVFQGKPNSDILEASTSLMRAALDHLKHSPELFQQMTDNDLQLILNGVNNCTESEVRANLLRMLGVLGCLLPEDLVKCIISFILETCSNEKDIWTISEAVDALMDVFSDNDWEKIVYELDLVPKSKNLERAMKGKLRQQKRDLGDRYPAVCTVHLNLSRFTKYIESQQQKYVPK